MLNIAPHLRPIELAHAEFSRAAYFHKPGSNVTIDDVLDPEYWSNIAARLKVGDLIEVRNDDFSIDCDLRVITVDPNHCWAVVMIRGRAETRPTIGSHTVSVDADGFSVYSDPVLKWCVRRGGDLLEKHLPTETDARKRLADIKARVPRKAA